MKEGTFTPAGPMTYEVFINSHWLEGSSDTLQVYGNVDEVKLQLNGRVIARQYPDDKPSTSEYVSRPDGGNAENIDFPPFTFFNVNWERGELKAIGYKDGKLWPNMLFVHRVRLRQWILLILKVACLLRAVIC